MPGFGTNRRTRVAKLRHKATLQQKVQSSLDGRGQPVYTWQAVQTKIPCSLQQLSGSELEQARQVYPEATYRVEMRYLSTVTEKMRLSIYDTNYYIGVIDDTDMVGRFMRLLVSEDTA